MKKMEDFLILQKDTWSEVRVSVVNWYFRSLWVVTRYDGNGNSVVRFELENTDTQEVVKFEKYDSALSALRLYVDKCKATGVW
jgi:predicted methyltransferase MtxX (methanogen marker protein 4)